MAFYIQTNQIVNLPNANLAISAADTGKTMLFTTLTGARTYTLPALAAGLHYRFINKAPGALGASAIIQGSGGAGNALLNGVLLKGGVVCAAVTARSAVNFITGSSVKGDFLDCYCDGVQWSVLGSGRVTGAFTLTA
jgi:hypothetical protein